MQTALELYESGLEPITDVCADPWFGAQLALSRAGDETAWRRISGSCLRLVLDTARARWSPGSSLDLLEVIQDGNRVLVRTLKRFRGSTAAEFLEELAQNLDAEFTRLLGPAAG
jgi:hypothetical protein